MKKRKIRILIICAMLAANLAACALFGGKTPAGVEDGGTAEETMSSTEAPTQDKVPQRSDDEDKAPQRTKHPRGRMTRGRMKKRRAASPLRSGAVKKLRRRSIFCWILMLCWMKITG